MPVETAADRLVFLDTDEFGASVVWTSEAGASAPFPAIFDNEYRLLISDLAPEGAEGSEPAIMCRTEDLPADAEQEDTLAITQLDEAGASVAVGSFKAVEFKPDGTGMTMVRLQEV